MDERIVGELNQDKPEQSLEWIVSSAMVEKELNQVDLADTAGVSQSLISNLLAGRRRRYTLNTLAKVGSALDIDVMVLVNAAASQETKSDDDIDAELESVKGEIMKSDITTKRRALKILRKLFREGNQNQREL